MNQARYNPLWLAIVNAAYTVAAAVGWPYYLYLLARHKKYRHALKERWGFVPRFEPGRKRLWVHAISVGEVEAARTFVPALERAFPETEIVLSTTTMTGRERAARLFPGRPLFYFPLDLAPCVLGALDRVQPTAVIQVESEWWPNFFWLARRRGIPIVCVNVRITEKAQRGYARIRGLMRAVFSSARAIGVQAEVYRQRLVSLGADAERIRITGQMKHDGVTFTDSVPGAETLARDMGIGGSDSVLVAGSTSPGETDLLLSAYRQVRERQPHLRLVIVPRRPENFDATAEAIQRAGFGCLRRSRPTDPPLGAPATRASGLRSRSGCFGGVGSQSSTTEPPVLLGDTMGELAKWYALAGIVFVGRSLEDLGGSNPMEPGALGRPLLWGPHMFNFPVEAAALLSAGAARQVENASALAAAVEDLLAHPERRRHMGDAARTAIRRMQGATQRTIDLVRESLREKDLS
jgi:3-deoxy-D-manno-octulosonic-acid transferase